ncbi:hypothetical protein DWQ65_12470 [Treponema phagedenis]|uniref:Uncharacterized protein n=1 Tax=Treponema phagedenis TaxID=162 RepID=A0A0B7GXY7_TREPH|nr:hypothetical protein [Treponema phagedenis]EFW36349.1 hypothetical protein HMPREF9554_03181 [Treponema phagedenis F0421]NVP23394.1 hypothetical protein [Treponema phagedenis]QEJ95614.1 hypothetical protein FUT79_10625 [Treponema phagedenis]QEJ98537.1 hypothetical protein FUT82_11375 [Treponema phagedenis]QEK01468.1 hypothetical protein FUT84_10105 [Treponema phagedenis]
MTHEAVPAAQIIIAIIPIVGIVTGGSVIFFYLLWRHKQIICQIENNIYIRPSFNLVAFCLLAGIMLTITGFVLTILFAIINGISYVLLGGLIPLAIGISFLSFFYYTTHIDAEILWKGDERA